METYPECEKMAKVSELSNQICSFYDWAVNKGYITNRKRFNHEKIMAEYFGIDLNKVELERRQILKNLS